MIEASLVAKLELATGQNVYPGVAPDDASAPFIIYNRSATPRETDFDGPTGIAYPVFRIDAYDFNYGDAVATANLIRVALNGYKDAASGILYCNLTNELDLSDITTDPKLSRRHLEFRITHRE